MAGTGGYQQPSSPAPVSGPGALSQRVDGGPGAQGAGQPIRSLPNAKYGENAQFVGQQQAAPVAGNPIAPTPGGPGAAAPQQAMPAPQPLTGGSVMPDQPITHGADAGPGADSSILGGPSPVVTQYQTAKGMVQQLAAGPNASPALRALAASIGNSY